MTAIDTDVAVIGAGTAGIVAERKARSAGARTVTLVPVAIDSACAPSTPINASRSWSIMMTAAPKVRTVLTMLARKVIRLASWFI